MSVLAAVLCALAVLLLGRSRPAKPGTSSWWWLVPAAVVLSVVLVVGRQLLPVLVLGLGAIGVAAIRRRTRANAAAAKVGAAVRECCEALAGELAAGIAPGPALAVATQVWAPIEAAVRADSVGSSVPDALRELAARHRGAGDLRQVAAAWQLSQRSGAALGSALTAVAADLADQAATRSLVRTELSSARATARLIAGLPVLTLAISSGTGDPVGFLLGSGAGLVCLAAGLALALLGLGWIERIAAGVEGAVG